jgi:uncharacterized BrkB/YihY/UPF0761 family membrane protein
MKRDNLISRIALWVLMAIGIICAVMFYLPYSEGSIEVAGDTLNIPRYTNLFLIWNYVLLGIACLITLYFVVVKFIGSLRTNPKRALTSLGIVLAFVCLIIVCWVLGSPEQVNIVGYEGTDNVGFMARLSDSCLYLTYVLLCASILTLICGRIYTGCLK